MTTDWTPDDDERQRYAQYASNHSDPRYRPLLESLYAAWHHFNEEHCQGRLKPVHLVLGPTHPRVLGYFSETTGHGAPSQIVINERLAFGDKREWVVNPWPAPGTRNMIEDLLRRFTVQQGVWEVEGTREAGYRGFGPLFTQRCNRVSVAEGLPPVIARRRGALDDGQPLAAFWPPCVRPEGYYGDDVTEELLELAAGTARTRRRPEANMGLLEYLLFLHAAGRPDEARRLIARHLDWLQTYRVSRRPALRRVEEGREDIDGSPLPKEIPVDPTWLLWSNHCVAKFAESILEYRSFADMPVLADALEDAGCQEGVILRHLRANVEHTARCWVLRRLIEAAQLC